MNNDHGTTVGQMLTNLRRIVRATDLHSKAIASEYGITVPQLILLRKLKEGGSTSVGSLAEQVYLSHATVTSIVHRLENRNMIERKRDENDRRVVLVQLTRRGEEKLAESPPLLQEDFVERFQQLEEWERLFLLTALERVASMLDAEELEAGLILAAGEYQDELKEGGDGADPLK